MTFILSYSSYKHFNTNSAGEKVSKFIPLDAVKLPSIQNKEVSNSSNFPVEELFVSETQIQSVDRKHVTVISMGGKPSKPISSLPKVIRFLRGWRVMQKRLPREVDCGSNHVCRLESVDDYNTGMADMAVFYGRSLTAHPPAKPNNQLWFLSGGESERQLPVRDMSTWDGFFNYTHSYFRASNVNNYKSRIYNVTTLKVETNRDFATEKRAKLKSSSFDNSALWFVSNCGSSSVSSARFEYATELSKYMNVTVGGGCSGRFRSKTPGIRRKKPIRGEPAMEKYLFYLAFENSLCRDYITEKYWSRITESHLTIPVVLGGLSIEDYERVAPENSFIHVKNFSSPAELAKHLKFVSQNDEAFNYYHQWRNKYFFTKPGKKKIFLAL